MELNKKSRGFGNRLKLKDLKVWKTILRWPILELANLLEFGSNAWSGGAFAG